MEVLIQNFSYITWQMLVMWGIGGVLIYLAIAKKMEPTLLLPMGFGAILVNLPIAVPGTGVIIAVPGTGVIIAVVSLLSKLGK